MYSPPIFPEDASKPNTRHVTLPQLAAVVIIIWFVGATFIAPAMHLLEPPRQTQSGCAGNEKQILMAMLAYAQDNDDRLPPVAGIAHLPTGAAAVTSWCADRSFVAVDGGLVTIPAVTSDFIKNSGICRCPSVDSPRTPLTYLYNDLAAGQSLMNDLIAPSRTVAVMDGEDALPNFGHARMLPGAHPRARGGAVSLATLERHSGGCNYGMADGHVKWFTQNAVFFPPRDSDNPEHLAPDTKQPVGPDPGGSMHYGATGYAVTFQIR